MTMKMTKIILGGLLAITATANAMPTQEETKKVEPLVMDLMKDDQVALKSGKKTRVEVAEAAMSLADKADSEAAKLLLIKGAFNLYVRAGEFDKAIETLQALQAAIPDIPPANMASIIESSLRVVPRKNGGQLYRLLDETKLRMRYTSAAKSLEKSVKQNPADHALRTKLAEHYAYLGKWDQALENFAAAEGKVAVIAKSERNGDAIEKVADFWWTYPNGKTEELVRAFRAHAAKLYEDAIAAGKITGLNKVQAERRIDEAKAFEEGLWPEKDPLGGVQLWEGGPYWAECNVGATKPEESGYYFWWGDTVGYKRNASTNGWISVKDGSVFSFVKESCPTFKKDNSQLLSAGYIDKSGNLAAEHDAATAHLGAPWRMPTAADFAALISNCKTAWTMRKGVYGRLVSGKGAYASRSIFLPAAGYGNGSDLRYKTGSHGRYWTSALFSGNLECAYLQCFDVSDFYLGNCPRYVGLSVRPLREFQNNPR